MAAKLQHIAMFNIIITNINVLNAAIKGISLHNGNTADNLNALTDFSQQIYNDLHKLAREIAELEKQINEESEVSE